MAQHDILPALLPGEPFWSPEDGEGLRAFLITPSGQRILRRLLYSRPEVSERRDSKVRRIQSDERAGFEACIAELLQLADPIPLTTEDRAAQTKES